MKKDLIIIFLGKKNDVKKNLRKDTGFMNL